MKQLGLQNIYTWKYHKEIPCVATLSQNMSFFFFFLYKIGEQEGRLGPAQGGSGWLVPEGGGRLQGKGVRE
jgi:hypothetical protein